MSANEEKKGPQPIGGGDPPETPPDAGEAKSATPPETTPPGTDQDPGEGTQPPEEPAAKPAAAAAKPNKPKPQQVRNQFDNPSSLALKTLDWNKYWYVRVEKDSPKWEGSMDEYLDRPSIIDPSKPMYELHSDDRKITGSNRMVILRCSIEDHVADQARIAHDAGARARAVAPDESFAPISV